MDKRKITSRINGCSGGRPKVWAIDPYKAIAWFKQTADTDPYSKQMVSYLQRQIDNRRERLKAQKMKKLSQYYKRPDLALKKMQDQKARRQKKLNELRYLRMVTRRLLLQLEEIGPDDLDIARETKPKI